MIVIDGNNLSLAGIKRIVTDPSVKVSLSAQVLENISKSRLFLESEEKKKIIYGVNTGFGPMASYIINDGQLTYLQRNLIRSHAVGIGLPMFYIMSILQVGNSRGGWTNTGSEWVEDINLGCSEKKVGFENLFFYHLFYLLSS